ncbi:MAG: hypothetical protein EAY81_01765 [Bacteroidetes bacterium]|nr:MAG: hypothetical protein EAY81_01765 [Bacteroidota bacterium]
MQPNPSFVQFAMANYGKERLMNSFPFKCFAFNNGQLLVCYIDLKTYINQSCPPNYFEQLPTLEKDARLILVWEDVWITQTDLVKQRIFALLGQSKRVHARQTQVVRIDKQTAFTFLEKNHLQGPTSAYYKFALMANHEILAVATFSKARIMHDGPTYYRSFELERFANLSGFTVVGGLSKLLHHFMSNHQVKHVMTYADRDWSSGNSYLKLGFVQQGFYPATSLYVHTKTFTRFFPNRLSVHQQQSTDFIKVYNAGSIKFVLNRP